MKPQPVNKSINNPDPSGTAGTNKGIDLGVRYGSRMSSLFSGWRSHVGPGKDLLTGKQHQATIGLTTSIAMEFAMASALFLTR
jgi:hypothetical protein